MIARIWSARSTPANAPAYAEHLRSRVLPDLRKTAGYGGAMLLERPAAGEIEIMVITFWHSAESIQAFSGPDLERAVVEDAAAAVLNRFDQRVRHYEISLHDRLSTAE